LRALAAPPGNPDRKEQKAADYLQGAWQLRVGDKDAAVVSLRAAVRNKGYEYDVYALALARALAAQGNMREARTLARQASERGSVADLRLDLERSRRDAARLLRQAGG
jgi:Flp pilus assembly protein TadD